MVNLMKIKCNDTTYVDKSRPNDTFYEEEKLIVGSVNNNLPAFNYYKSLLRFHISNLNLDLVDSIYLFLFVENIKFNYNTTANIGILGNVESSQISNINWWTFPKKSTSKQINLNVPCEAIGKYLKIDISPIIKSLNSYNNIYNFIIESMNFNSTSVVQFSSKNSSNPPYLGVANTIINEKQSFTNFDSKPLSSSSQYSSNSSFKNIMEENVYDKILNLLNSQSLQINALENKIFTLNDTISTLNDKLDKLNKNTKIDN